MAFSKGVATLLMTLNAGKIAAGLSGSTRRSMDHVLRLRPLRLAVQEPVKAMNDNSITTEKAYRQSHLTKSACAGI